jgi:hypothetical protein
MYMLMGRMPGLHQPGQIRIGGTIITVRTATAVGIGAIVYTRPIHIIQVGITPGDIQAGIVHGDTITSTEVITDMVMADIMVVITDMEDITDTVTLITEAIGVEESVIPDKTITTKVKEELLIITAHDLADHRAAQHRVL